MRRKKIILIMAMCMTVITACSKNSTSEQGEQKETLKSVASGDVTEEIPVGKDIVTDYTQFQVAKEEQSYIYETDQQFYMKGWLNGAKVENGYIFDDGRLHIFDEESHTYSVACAKPECRHEGETCPAMCGSTNGMEYYNSELYYLAPYFQYQQSEESIVQYFLRKKSLKDGNDDKLAEFTKIMVSGGDETMTDYIHYFQHRGYLYYAYVIGSGQKEENFHNNGSNCIYRIPIDGKGEPECIFVMDVGYCIDYIELMGQGSYVYFCTTDSSGFGEVYRYNTESDVVEKMNIGTIAEETFTVVDGTIVYKKKYDDKILYRYDPMTNEEKVFADMTEWGSGDSWDVSSDNTYVSVYYTNGDTGEAYEIYMDHQGDYVGRIILSTEYKEGEFWGYNLLGGDEYQIMQSMDGVLKYAKKADMETEEIIYMKDVSVDEK